MKTKVFGDSDDLVELEGAIFEEFGAWDETLKMDFSDGTKLTAKYDGTWLIRVVKEGSKFIKRVEAVGEETIHDGTTNVN